MRPAHQFGFNNGAIKLSKKQHGDFLDWLVTKHIEPAKQIRDSRAIRFDAVDIDYHGHTVFSDEDLKRLQDKQRGGPEKPTQSKIPFAGSHINRIAETLLLIFKDNLGLYQATSNKNRVDLARALTDELNKQSSTFGHVSALNSFLIQIMKYDLGGMVVSWEEDSEPNIEVTEQQQIAFTDETRVRGNFIKCIDVYNTLFDPSVSPRDVAKEGQFFATVEVVSEFTIAKQEEAERIVMPANKGSLPDIGERWYREPPVISNSNTGQTGVSVKTPWYAGLGDDTPHNFRHHELTTVYMWLVPKEHDISSSNKYEMFKIVILDGDLVVQIDPLDFAHKMLPLVVAEPLAEEEETNNRSLFEVLQPLQSLANFGLNAHIASHRNALTDLVFIDKRVADTTVLDPEKRVHLVDGTKTDGKRIQDSVAVFQHAPLSNSLEAITTSTELMELIAPTGTVEDLANLDRATEFQAQAVHDTAGRATNKLAIIVQDQALRSLIAMLYFNTIQNLTVLDSIDENGEPSEIPITDIVKHNVRFDLGNGLKTLDKARIERFWITLLDRIIQSQQALQEVDVVAVLDHVSSLAGDGQDVSAFRKITPLSQMSPEDQQLAFQLLQQEKQKQTEAQVEESNEPAAVPEGPL